MVPATIFHKFSFYLSEVEDLLKTKENTEFNKIKRTHLNRDNDHFK